MVDRNCNVDRDGPQYGWCLAAGSCDCCRLHANGVCMSSTCHKIGLRRSSDLATSNAAIAARLPEMAASKIGLTEIAELCKRDLYARPARDCGSLYIGSLA